MAQLKSTVYVTDPQTHQTVTLDAGTNPPARLAALVTNPAAWVDGKLPTAAKKTAQDSGDGQGNGPDAAAGASSAAADNPPEATGDKPTAKKAVNRPARGRTSGAEGSSD
ncbi:hypothetical protein [Streptomyces sp. NPDC017529]|uniref:hypothetical protein n=1 Tax=Streptomyces sp. NPDC017529 TaxID=3365000 RepID=UPI0037B072C6